MKRAVLLGITTVMWVVAIQVITGVMQPTREIDLTTNDLAPERNAFAVSGEGAGLIIPLRDFFDRVGRSPASTWSVEDIPLPSTTTTPPPTTTTPITTPTTTSPPPTTTTTRPVTATTKPPTTTTAPVATAPPPATTAPPPTTTAPPTTAVPAPSGNFNSSAEADFLGRINGLRGSVGVAVLTPNAELNNYARWWAKYMAENNKFAHSNIGDLLNPWTIVGENIAAGGTVGAMFDGLVGSSGHYKNMVETRFIAVGVGVWVDANGRLWTCHVFAG